MKILYLTLESPFDPALVVRGNAIRARGLIAGLEHRGFEVAHVWRAPYDGSTVDPNASMYDGPEQLADLIGKISPDIVIAGYWNLVFDLPDSVTAPVIVDFIAPRPLEALFEDPDRRDTETRRLLTALERAQGFVVASARQGTPVDSVSVDGRTRPASTPARGPCSHCRGSSVSGPRHRSRFVYDFRRRGRGSGPGAITGLGSTPFGMRFASRRRRCGLSSSAANIRVSSNAPRAVPKPRAKNRSTVAT